MTRAFCRGGCSDRDLSQIYLSLSRRVLTMARKLSNIAAPPARVELATNGLGSRSLAEEYPTLSRGL